MQNLAPGAAARLGLGYEQLAAQKPGIIVCDISGYGEDGPYRDKKAYDLLIQSEAGFVSVTGTADEPSKAGPSIADIAAGMYAYTNILAALLQRQQTGAGQHIDVSMLESLTEWTSYPLYYAFDGAPPPPRTGLVARHHLPVRTVPDRGRRVRVHGPAERAGVGRRSARPCCSGPTSPPTRGSPATPPGSPSAPRSRRSSTTSSAR